MWWAGSSAAAPNRSARLSSAALATLVARVEEPVPQELELDLIESVLVEERAHLAERPGLEDVLEVGVPEPDAPKPDAGGLLAAVAEVEQAPLAPEVHLHRPGRGPVERDQIIASAHRSTT